jgi:hypothetical protein
MNSLKLQLLACLLTFTFTGILSAQNGWTTCSTTAGLLNGTTTDVIVSGTTAASVFTTSPSPTGTIPQTEFLIILQDSMSADSLGWAIIGTSIDGSVSPASLNMSVGDTFSVASFSYDIQQIKLAVQGLLFNSVIILGPCCGILDSQAPIPGICDSLNAAGIQDSSDINNINDLLTFLGAFSGGGSTSLRGLNAVLVAINASIGTLNSLGCTNGVGEVCYAADSLASNHDHFAVISATNIFEIEGNENLKIAVSPNPFSNQLSTIIMTETVGSHSIRVFDATGRTVYQQVKHINSGEQNINIELGGLAAGLYYLQVSDNKNIATQKIIKR